MLDFECPQGLNTELKTKSRVYYQPQFKDKVNLSYIDGFSEDKDDETPGLESVQQSPLKVTKYP